MLTTIAFAFCAFAGLTHVTTCLTVALRLRRRPRPRHDGNNPPFVSIIRPVCGLETNLDVCLKSSFELTSNAYELIFCVEDETDSAAPLVRQLIEGYPQVDAKLLVGRDHVSANPKVNNVAKGWAAARSEWIVISDSNTVLPPAYIENLWAHWGPKTGVVSAAMIVTEPEGFAADIECAYLNSYETRWMLVADAYRLAFAHGKTVMLKRDMLDDLGGIAALDREAADELAATKIAREKRLEVRLARHPVEQPIGRRSFAAVWRRQVRWARLRRAGIPLIYATEILSIPAIPFAIAIGLAATNALAWAIVPAYIAGWYAVELLFVRASRWPFPARLPLAMIVRDLIAPAIWLSGWFGKGTQWRGKAVPFPDRVRKKAVP